MKIEQNGVTVDLDSLDNETVDKIRSWTLERGISRSAEYVKQRQDRNAARRAKFADKTTAQLGEMARKLMANGPVSRDNYGAMVHENYGYEYDEIIWELTNRNPKYRNSWAADW